MKNWPQHSLTPKPDPEQGPNFNSVKAERGEEAADKKLEASTSWLMKFKAKKKNLRNIEVEGEAEGTDGNSAASYAENLAKKVKVGTLTRFSM